MKTKEVIQKSGLDLIELREQGISLQELANLVFDETNVTISPASIRNYILEMQEAQEAKEGQEDTSEHLNKISSLSLFSSLSRYILERAYILAQEASKDLSQPLPQAEIGLLKVLRSLDNGNLSSFLNGLDKDKNKTPSW